jgi:hypothetical protein
LFYGKTQTVSFLSTVSATIWKPIRNRYGSSLFYCAESRACIVMNGMPDREVNLQAAIYRNCPEPLFFDVWARARVPIVRAQKPMARDTPPALGSFRLA